MAPWEASRRQPEAQPVAQPAEPPVGTAVVAERRKPRISKPRAQRVTARRFADPFADDDDGANCLRCGLLVGRARENRGLATCSRCG